MDSNTCSLEEIPQWVKYSRSGGILSEQDYKDILCKVVNKVFPYSIPTKLQASSNIRKWQDELTEEQIENAILAYTVLRLWTNDGLPENLRCPIVTKNDGEVMAESVIVSLSI